MAAEFPEVSLSDGVDAVAESDAAAVLRFDLTYVIGCTGKNPDKPDKIQVIKKPDDDTRSWQTRPRSSIVILIFHSPINYIPILSASM